MGVFSRLQPGQIRMTVHPLSQQIPDADVLVSMPVEELGLYVLKVLAEMETHNDSYNAGNFILSMWAVGTEGYGQGDKDRVDRAVAEAFHWLKNTGLLAPVPNDNASNGFCHISRKGQAALEQDGITEVLASTIVDRMALHPRLQDTVWSLFVRKDYDAAIFQAFKEVEVAVRDAAELDRNQYGPPMMRTAFSPDSGPLVDPNGIRSEREAVASLYAGSIGIFKNPQSHRDVAIQDGIEAAEVIYLASHLLRIVDRRRSQ